MLMAENIYYHGTSTDIVGGAVLKGKIPLIGKRLLTDSAWSGTLTNDKNYATRIAQRRGGDPIVLSYILPGSIVIDEGVIGMQDRAHGFVTNIEVELSKLPKAYLTAMLGMNMLSLDILKMLVQRGDMSFHAVPFEYLSNIQDA